MLVIFLLRLSGLKSFILHHFWLIKHDVIYICNNRLHRRHYWYINNNAGVQELVSQNDLCLENLFLVRKTGINPPQPASTKCTYPERATNVVFRGKRDAARACGLKGNGYCSENRSVKALLSKITCYQICNNQFERIERICNWVFRFYLQVAL